MSRPEEARLFVAIELPEGVLRALAEVQERLRERSLDGLRWVRPEGIHLTLKFLGETPAEKLPDIERALEQAVRGIGPHRLALGRLGTFGSRGAPRVLWVDLAGDVETLGALQEGVERALSPLGFPRDERRFSPHLTLARIRPEDAREVARPLSEAVATVRPPEAQLPVTELSLMRSELRHGGAVYTRLRSVGLG
jgi:2'-5' RNA ligase